MPNSLRNVVYKSIEMANQIERDAEGEKTNIFIFTIKTNKNALKN